MATADWENLLLWQPKHVVKAKKDYKSNHPLDLSFEVGDIIEVLGIENDDWWNGTITDTDTFGSFPCSFVEIIVDGNNDYADYEEQEEIEMVPKLPPRIKLNQRKFSTKSANSAVHQDYSDEDNVGFRKVKVIDKKEYNNDVEEAANHPTRKNGKNNSVNEKKIMEKFDPVSRCTVVYDKNFEAPLDLSEVDFEIVDDHARSAPKDVEKSIDRLSNYLTSEWTHPIYKLRCVFAWVAHNIAYDCDAFYGGGVRYNSAKDVLKHRRAVCAGYSELFDELASAANLDTWKVSGEAKGAGYQPGDEVKGTGGHAWNACRLDGEYFLIDCTWGAGVVSNLKFERKFNPFYFMASPLHLIYTHFPENSREQYLRPPIRFDEFVGLPFFKPEWFTSGFRMAKYHECVIEVENDLVEFEIEKLPADDERRPGGSLEWKGQKIEAFINYLGRVDDGKQMYRLQCSIPSSGNGIMTIFSFNKTSGIFACSYKIINHGSGSNYQPFVKIYPTPFQFSLISPIQPTLAYNQRTKFEVILFNQERLRDLPTISVHSHDFKKKRTLEPCGQINKQDKSVRLSAEVVLSVTGQWILSYSMNGENMFHFIATFECSDDEDENNARPSNYGSSTSSNSNSFGGISYENLHSLGEPTGQVLPVEGETSSSLPSSSSSIIFGDATSSNPRDTLFLHHLHPAPTTVINLVRSGSQSARTVINLDQERTSISGDGISNIHVASSRRIRNTTSNNNNSNGNDVGGGSMNNNTMVNSGGPIRNRSRNTISAFSNGPSINGNSDSRPSHQHSHYTSAFHPYQNSTDEVVIEFSTNNNSSRSEQQLRLQRNELLPENNELVYNNIIITTTLNREEFNPEVSSSENNSNNVSSSNNTNNDDNDVHIVSNPPPSIRNKFNNNKPPPEGHVTDLTESSIVICSECDEPLREGLWVLNCSHVVCTPCEKKLTEGKKKICPSCNSRVRKSTQLYV
ncbi:13627_t:CDS:10 [Ambispora gerdemannii]|uniref:13627_t:CDS:1 n=1 Tax=Ambispora gerdemannii TaxID=144530 RepID=A0A9N8VFQ2_9GLOM|nr:13627_t:CDS:10 [Ambispora gerdemannii]